MSDIRLDEIKLNSEPRVTFNQILAGDPCSNCTSPCCRIVLLPHKPPSTFLEMDHIRYMLGFPTIQMVVTYDGKWYVGVVDNCSFLDIKTNLCTVHGTPRQPQVCRNLNQYQCWYKRNFTDEAPPELVRLDEKLFEQLLEIVHFDQEGRIVDGLTWEGLQELVMPHQQPLTS